MLPPRKAKALPVSPPIKAVLSEPNTGELVIGEEPAIGNTAPSCAPFAVEKLPIFNPAPDKK